MRFMPSRFAPRRGRGLIAAICVLLAVLAVPTPALAASGGGCTTDFYGDSRENITVGTCISYDGHRLLPDYYISSPKNVSSHCDVFVYVEAGGTTSYVATGSCTPGHHGPYGYIASASPARTVLYVDDTPNRLVNGVHSPWQFWP